MSVMNSLSSTQSSQPHSQRRRCLRGDKRINWRGRNKMSRVTRERGEQKREEIRKIIWGLMNECINSKFSPEETGRTINKHIQVMMYAKPQENHLVISVAIEIKQDVDAFCKRMHEKYGVP
jgi:hypothetical protein